MGALKIECYCDEKKMSDILSMVENHLQESDIRELSDLDKEIGGIRICVDFNTYMDEVKLKGAEILDSDWDLLYEDTAVLNSRLKKVISDFNINWHKVVAQAYDVKSDRLKEIGIY
ncbi:hypothetical protein [Dysgonomonas sp. ZJ279]|uniref:hypothetical protein n=1 Tax=Dysgonomonas sp. ZJ279 TaxID=2709796 RepID=UPI0013EB99AE|nr:hypothetical protein [Dysgonomonas sp. ZJ279]